MLEYDFKKSSVKLSISGKISFNRCRNSTKRSSGIRSRDKSNAREIDFSSLNKFTEIFQNFTNVEIMHLKITVVEELQLFLMPMVHRTVQLISNANVNHVYY